MLLLSLLFGSLVVAAPTGSLVVHEKRATSRLDVNPGGQRVARDSIIPIRIALAQSNLEKGYDYLMGVSDPHSEDFGKHWSLEEIHAKFAPSEEAIEAVKAWLESAGIQREDILETTSKGWVGVDMPAGDAERLFATEYYEHVDSKGRVDVGCDRYHVPSHLSSHIDFVKPGVMITSFNKRSVERRSSESANPRSNPFRFGRCKRPYHHHKHHGHAPSCGDAITPACIKALYDIPDAKYHQPENKVGVFENEESMYDQADLNLFFAKYAPEIPQGTHPTVVSINGGEAPNRLPNPNGDEAVVDLDIIYSLTYPQQVVYYQETETPRQKAIWAGEVPGSANNKDVYVEGRGIIENLLNAVDGSFCSQEARNAGADCGTAELTRVLSISYGVAELFYPEAVIRRACHEYMKLGLKGHTVLVSSGDEGAADSIGCRDPAHLDNIFITGSVFSPNFPASCPYVTSVGATQLNHGETVNDPETALVQPGLNDPDQPLFGSGGGFSNYFPRPGFQSSAVGTYLSDYNPGYPTYTYNGKATVGAGGGLYNKAGRGIPDISANGANLEVFVNTDVGPIFGTSLSAPIWAGIVTLINEERTAAGKGPVGFINPVLYDNADVFTDITRGGVPECNTEGYSCVPGWDPVTGLGTPNYPTLLEVFMKLP